MNTKNYLFNLLLMFLVTTLIICISSMLDYNYSAILALLSVLLLIATVYALYHQNKRLSSQLDVIQKQMKIAENDSLYKLAIEVDKAFLSNYDLCPYFNDGQEVENDCDKNKLSRIDSLAILKLDYYELVIGLYADNSAKDSWDNYFIEGFKSGPALRMAYKKHEKWFSNNLKELFNKAEKELNKK